MLGYFEIESMKTGAILGKGLSDDLKFKIGRIRDYELSGAHNVLYNLVVSVTIATLLLF